MAGKKSDTPTPVVDFKYKDKRKNIPTHELRDFVAEMEKRPQTILYPRDLSLDPQLVWKGKDEQDREDLAVPCVPVYIQEKILPKAIIEEVRAQGRKERPQPQASLFADFNGLGFEEMVDFYRHPQNWSNRLILGDSLLVMTSLAEKEGLKGQVQMIYLDPPYGIKFGSNWQVSTRKREVKDGKLEDLTRQPEQIRAYRDTWKLGIHSYLTYLRDRLVVARELLTETGSIFIQIGDENVHLVRILMDEVFGSENFQSLITVRKTGGLGSTGLKAVSDYILWYSKNNDAMKYRQIYLPKSETAVDEAFQPISHLEQLIQNGKAPGVVIPENATGYITVSLTSSGTTETCIYGYTFNGKEYWPVKGYSWKPNKDSMDGLKNAGRLIATGNTLRWVYFREDFPVSELTNSWADTGGAPDKIYVVQTNLKLIERCLIMATDPGDLVLDPTCGSGTTAYVAEKWGRRWLTLDTSRVALALARTRLMAAKYPYYLLADSPEGLKKEAELTGQLPADPKTEGDIRKGFVYKRVPHITLRAIANNPEIKAGMRRDQINAAISRRADTELLYDQPYEDGKRLRVTGPFTVESLSPHRVLAPEQELTAAEAQAQREDPSGQFVTMILENLKKAGVQNTVKQERLRFDRLESFSGTNLHAEGEYTEEGGVSRRVAVCIGPEHGTVGPDLVKDATKEAVKGLGFDLLIVCGFAFDPHVSEEVKQYGKLTVLPARMNPDLAMGDELLKKTGAGNLFMVFGEPDVEVRREKDGQIMVEIKGLDIYDPTTGQIRSNTTDDLACWFIDTDYNGESFFVRHAYFTGADQPYDKLKRALRADIDEAAWSALYSTVSRPFPPPATGKIAIKVINHYGDEVLKVYEV